MRFVEFKNPSGKEIWINADRVDAINETDGSTVITTGFFTQLVQETPREVLKKIEPPTTGRQPTINTNNAFDIGVSLSIKSVLMSVIENLKKMGLSQEYYKELTDMLNEQYPAPEKKPEPKSDFNLLFGAYKKVEENFKRLGLLKGNNSHKRAFERGYRKGKNETLAKCLTAVYNKLYETKQLSHNLIEDIHQTMLDAARR